MHIVEFFGIPGSGKTTVAALVKKALKKRGLHVLDVEEAFYYCISLSSGSAFFRGLTRCMRSLGISYKALRLYFNRFVVGPDRVKSIVSNHRKMFEKERPELVDLVSGQIRNTHLDEADREAGLAWFYEFIGWDSLFRRYLPPETIVITDEWFIHEALCSLASEKSYGRKEKVEKYLALVPESTMVIHIKADLSQCLSRIKSRNEGHVLINNLSEKEGIRYLENNHKTAENILNSLKNVVKIDNNGSISDLAFDLTSVVNVLQKSI